MTFAQALKTKRLYLDGAMGSQIQERVPQIPLVPEELNITNPRIIGAIQADYVAAGSQILLANTFGANAHKTADSRYSVEELVSAAVAIARDQHPDYVLLDVGPLGSLVGELGDVPFEEAIAVFARTVRAGAAAGVDGILIETMTDIYEARAAVIAANENCDLPVIASMTYETNGRTLTGTDPMTAVTILEALGVDAVGINCSTGPRQMMPLIEALLENAHVPLMVEPNAGLPRVADGKTLYDVSPEAFAGYMADIAKAGAAVLGGCCGTTPAHIRAMRKAIESIPVRAPQGRERTCIATATHTTVLGEDIQIIGECINPSANAALKEELRRGDLTILMQLARRQRDEGAAVLDVNVGLPEIDEKEAMVRAVAAADGAAGLPLQFDSTDPAVLEAALRSYNGKPIINSVNGEERAMAAILPLAKKYGACVLGLTLDEEGLPKTAEKRVAIADKIIARAQALGIPRRDILIDCLTLTVSAQQERVRATLDAVTAIREKHGVATVLGVSNISFGLPQRGLINRTFLAMAMEAGLTTPILNPGDRDMMDTIDAYRALDSRDQNCLQYIQSHQDAPVSQGIGEEAPDGPADLKTIVVEGRRDEAAEATRRLLETREPMEIVNGFLIPGLDIVGQAFETGEAFLPNLIFAAETVQNAFAVIKAAMGEGARTSKGRILLATVKGDVHDIGKNILKVILENYGFEIIDLGRDVEIQEIVDTVKAQGIRLVGLSALMTTTVRNMETTIDTLREECPGVLIMVGGAVLNPEYAQSIGADFYGADARAGVEIAQKVFCD